eukprot:13554-Heterococcus_DN1.PRE.1
MAVPDLEALLQQLQELHGLVGTVITQDEYITHASIAVREALPQSEEQAQQAQAGRAQQTGAVPATAAETGAADFDAAYQKYDAEISDEDSDGDWSDEQEDEEEEDGDAPLPAAAAGDSATPTTQSTVLREEGNALFRSGKQDTSMARVVRVTRFERAAECYAAAAAVPGALPAEHASALKNQAVALREAAQLLQSGVLHHSEAPRLGQLMAGALSATTQALAVGYALHKEAAWCDVLDCVRDDVFDLCQGIFLDADYGGSTKFVFEHTKTRIMKAFRSCRCRTVHLDSACSVPMHKRALSAMQLADC